MGVEQLGGFAVRRLTPMLLAAALVTAAVGFSGLAGAVADYFRVLAGVLTMLAVCGLFGRQAARSPGR
jgi:uncharacterized membrane protein YtjA (UPF0391 family)